MFSLSLSVPLTLGSGNTEGLKETKLTYTFAFGVGHSLKTASTSPWIGFDELPICRTNSTFLLFRFLSYADPGLCYIVFYLRHANQRKAKVPHRKNFESPKKETERPREYKLVKNDNFSLPTFSTYMNFSACAFLDDN